MKCTIFNRLKNSPCSLSWHVDLVISIFASLDSFHCTFVDVASDWMPHEWVKKSRTVMQNMRKWVMMLRRVFLEYMLYICASWKGNLFWLKKINKFTYFSVDENVAGRFDKKLFCLYTNPITRNWNNERMCTNVGFIFQYPSKERAISISISSRFGKKSKLSVIWCQQIIKQ